MAARLAADRPVSPKDSTRRSARPTRSRTVRSIDAAIPASVASEANRTPTPRAIATTDRAVRPRRAARLRRASEISPPIGALRRARGAGLRGASEITPPIGSETDLGEAADQRAGVVLGPPAEGDL